MNEVFETVTFSKLVEACDKQEQRWIEKIKDHLAENLRIGKPLHFSWFREKKFGNKRVFYLINEKSRKAVLVAFGSKKDQQKIINHILDNKEIYLTFIT